MSLGQAGSGRGLPRGVRPFPREHHADLLVDIPDPLRTFPSHAQTGLDRPSFLAPRLWGTLPNCEVQGRSPAKEHVGFKG